MSFKRIFNSKASFVSASIIGSLLTTIVLTVAITLVWPFGDTVEQIFAGGTFFFVFWALVFYWAILSKNGTQAWKRVLTIFLPITLFNAIKLLYFNN